MSSGCLHTPDIVWTRCRCRACVLPVSCRRPPDSRNRSTAVRCRLWGAEKPPHRSLCRRRCHLMSVPHRGNVLSPPFQMAGSRLPILVVPSYPNPVCLSCGLIFGPQSFLSTLWTEALFCLVFSSTVSLRLQFNSRKPFNLYHFCVTPTWKFLIPRNSGHPTVVPQSPFR